MCFNIYATGGAATNAVKKFISANKWPNDGQYFGNPVINVFDTSSSNVDDTLTDANVFITPGTDGAGKKSSVVRDPIKNCIAGYVLKTPPAKMNFIIHSCGGGTGRIAGPILLNEIYQANPEAMVAVIAIENHGSLIEKRNTFDALNQYNLLVNKHDRTIPIFLVSDDGKTREEVDKEILGILTLSTLFWSEKNAEVDSSDREGLLNPETRVDIEPMVMMIRYHPSSPSTKTPDEEFITLCSMNSDGELDPTVAAMNFMYRCNGVVNAKGKDISDIKLPVYLTGVDGAFGPVMSSLKKSIDQQVKETSVRSRKSAFDSAATLEF